MSRTTGTMEVCDDDCIWQSYANLLDYIKLNLGAGTNDFEFSDDQIIDIICKHTLPLFSKYNPLIRYYRMTDSHNLITENPTLIYQFKNFGYKIMKINMIAPTSSIQDMNMLYSQALRTNAQDVTDFLMNMNYMHMSNIAVAPNVWRFFAPDKIEIIRTHDALTFSRDFITEVACIHKEPSTINPDLYSYMRDLALADIMIYIGRIRSKFENFATPFGEVQVASRSWVDEGNTLRRETIEAMTSIPPEDFLFFLD